jgi:hypothetical protein
MVVNTYSSSSALQMCQLLAYYIWLLSKWHIVFVDWESAIPNLILFTKSSLYTMNTKSYIISRNIKNGISYKSKDLLVIFITFWSICTAIDEYY